MCGGCYWLKFRLFSDVAAFSGLLAAFWSGLVQSEVTFRSGRGVLSNVHLPNSLGLSSLS